MSKCCLAIAYVLTVAVPIAFAADTLPTAAQLKSADWWLQRAIKFADQVPAGEDRSEAHYKLTYALANKGHFGRAMTAASQVSEPQIRVYAFSYVAKKAQLAGDEATCTEALKIARAAATPAEIGQTNAHMVRLYFDVGRSDEALPFANALPHPTQRLFAISNVVAGYAREGNVDRAMEIVRTALPATWLDSQQVTVVHALADGDHFDQAIALIEKIQERGSKDNAYGDVANKLADAGQVERARTLAAKITDQRRRGELLAQIATAAVKSGDGSLAESFAKATTRQEKTSLGMLRIEELIKAKKVTEAEALIESLVRTIEQSPAEPQVSKFGTFDDGLVIATIKANYVDTARLLKKSGDEVAAKARVEKAVAAIKSVTSQGLGKMMLHQTIIRGLNELGETAVARELIQHQDTPYTRATSAGDIAAALIRQGKVAEGLQLANESVADRSMAYGTQRVAIALLTVNRYDELADYLAGMPDNKNEVRAFREIAQEMVKIDQLEQLNHLIDKLPSAAARCQACLGAHDMLGSR